jgi:hypothetical protein
MMQTSFGVPCAAAAGSISNTAYHHTQPVGVAQYALFW